MVFHKMIKKVINAFTETLSKFLNYCFTRWKNWLIAFQAFVNESSHFVKKKPVKIQQRLKKTGNLSNSSVIKCFPKKFATNSDPIVILNVNFYTQYIKLDQKCWSYFS